VRSVSELVRRLVPRALVALAAAALVLALVAGYVRRAAVDSDQFANRAAAALSDDSVRSLVAERVTDEVILKNEENLVAARPIIQSVVSAVAGSRAFRSLFRAAVRDVHRALFDRDANTVTLTVADVGTVLAAVLEEVRPTLARQLESTGRVALVNDHIGSLGGSLARLADRVRLLALLLLAFAVAFAAAALAVSADRRRGVVQLGVGAAVGGILLIVALGVLRSLAVHDAESPEGQAAAGAVWDAFLGDLRTAGWVLAGAGAIVAAAASSLIAPFDIRGPLRRAVAKLASEPRSPSLRVLRGVGLVAAGLLALLEREAVIQLLFTLAGVYLIYEGTTAILRLIYRPRAPEEKHPLRRLRPPGRRVVTASVAAGLIAAAVAIFVGTGGTTTAAPPAGVCNGHGALCNRTLDQVVLLATHNSMSVPLPGWYSSQQDRPIADQLTDGVRGLLIDTHYADRLSNGRLRTYFGSREELRSQAKQDGVNADAVDSALRIRERLGFQGEGERGMYLCHSFCELGGTKLESALDDLHDFLVAHPGAVVVVINQDYVTPADFVAAVKDAGLDDLVYRGDTGDDWATLGEMIDDNQRLVLLAENEAGAASWYRPAYRRITTETPYSFSNASDLTDSATLAATCKRNRGPASAPVFLLNHWITTDPVPLPSDAAKVNAYEPLLRRARECRGVRDHLPNLVAVNFYRHGDAFEVVDKLNGVD
jgi:hypothetical protein